MQINTFRCATEKSKIMIPKSVVLYKRKSRGLRLAILSFEVPSLNNQTIAMNRHVAKFVFIPFLIP